MLQPTHKTKRTCIHIKKLTINTSSVSKTARKFVKALNAFCEERGITSGTIYGIGAIDELTLRFFNPQTKQYVDKTYQEQMEIANLTGNISQMDGKTYLHLHITVGRSDYSALAGHLLSATLNGAENL